jgi:catechol 2,3-dioxygenase-like lactoylglutathione lyase family enzyme
MTQEMMFSGIEVPDMDKAKAFYIDALGLKIALQIGRPGDPVHELALTFSGNPASGELSSWLGTALRSSRALLSATAWSVLV